MNRTISELVTRIRASMSREGFFGRPGVTPEEIRAFEVVHQVRLPEMVRQFYLHMDGMDDPNWEPSTMTRIWPLAEVNPVAVEFPDPSDPDHSRYPGAFCFADHSIWAWGYAIQLLPPAEPAPIYLVGGRERLIYTPSFADFLASIGEGQILTPHAA